MQAFFSVCDPGKSSLPFSSVHTNSIAFKNFIGILSFTNYLLPVHLGLHRFEEVRWIFDIFCIASDILRKNFASQTVGMGSEITLFLNRLNLPLDSTVVCFLSIFFHTLILFASFFSVGTWETFSLAINICFFTNNLQRFKIWKDQMVLKTRTQSKLPFIQCESNNYPYYTHL